jgi:drug/metabolite transporter (DMT)-like permease
MNDRRLGFARCGAAAVLFGLSTPAAARLSGDLGPFHLAGLLYLGAAIAVTPIVLRKRPTRGAMRTSARPLTTAVVLGGALGPVLLAAGLTRLDAATASLLLNLELVFTTVVAATLFREHLGRRTVIGTLFVLAGSIVIGWSDVPTARWGTILIAAACLCWAIDNSVTAAIDQLAPSHITAVKGYVAGTTNLVIGLLVDGWSVGGASLAALAVGAVGYGASITLWVAGARQLGAARGQLVFASAPFIGAIASWTVLGDPVTGGAMVATVCAAIGVLLVVGSDHTHGHAHDPHHHDHDHTHDDDHHDHHHDPPVRGRHRHPHDHQSMVHAHPHVPDLHHRHDRHDRHDRDDRHDETASG